MTDFRQCSRPGCNSPAVATLRYNYRASRATVTSLGPSNDPHSWDLCGRHVSRLTVPEGWELVQETAGTLGDGDLPADTSDFTDEEMQVLAEALEAFGGDDGRGGFSDAQDAESAHDHAASLTRAPQVIRREDQPRPTGHHPSRRNLPRRTPARHLRAVQDGE